MEKIFFQSSLPRAGSTLLQNIMGQNPDIFASPTSGMMELIYGARVNYTSSPEFTAIKDKDALKRGFAAFCNNGIHGYASEVSQGRKYYLDKGRSWSYYITWLNEFMPYTPKVICMVRDMRDIYCSMEKIFRKNPDKDKAMINWAELRNTTVIKRMDHWANSAPIGIAIDRLQEILHQGYAHKILFVKYESLCLNPDYEMKRIYQYLEIPYYQHNFDMIPQITEEDDSLYGDFGDHIIRNRLELTNSTAQVVLGPDICAWITKRYEWFFKFFNYNI
jgi:sulfotransferase